MGFSFNSQSTIAILIGTGQYLTEDFSPIDPIKGNLEDLKNILTDKSIIGLEESNVYVLENKMSTEILKTIKELIQRPDLKTIFIYYSGHGHRTSKDKLFLTAINSEKDFDLIEMTGIEFTKLKSIIENCPSKPSSIIILDACYSGIAAQSDSALTENEKDISGACIITSASNKEQSFFDPSARNTYFTEALVDVLRKGNENFDDYISINEIYKNVKDNLKSRNLSEPHRKDNLDSSSFYFAKNKKFDKEFFTKKAEDYFLKGNYRRALEYYKILDKRFSLNTFEDKIKTCEFEISYSKLIIEADTQFTKGKYEESLENYLKAENIKFDGSISYKIDRCKEYIKVKKQVLENQRLESGYSVDLSDRSNSQNEKDKNDREKKEKEDREKKEKEEKEKKDTRERSEREHRMKIESEQRLKYETDTRERLEREQRERMEREQRENYAKTQNLPVYQNPGYNQGNKQIVRNSKPESSVGKKVGCGIILGIIIGVVIFFFLLMAIIGNS